MLVNSLVTKEGGEECVRKAPPTLTFVNYMWNVPAPGYQEPMDDWTCREHFCQRIMKTVTLLQECALCHTTPFYSRAILGWSWEKKHNPRNLSHLEDSKTIIVFLVTTAHQDLAIKFACLKMKMATKSFFETFIAVLWCYVFFFFPKTSPGWLGYKIVTMCPDILPRNSDLCHNSLTNEKPNHHQTSCFAKFHANTFI